MKKQAKPFLSIIIPCYNEEKRIIKSVNKITEYINLKKLDTELIFINDGSTDKTKEVLSNLRNIFSSDKFVIIKIVSCKNNYGKGHAIKRGIVSSTGKYIL